MINFAVRRAQTLNPASNRAGDAGTEQQERELEHTIKQRCRRQP